MKILMAAAEFSPLARTGGLGEAIGGLSHALARAGHAVTVAIPRYRHLQDLGEARAGDDGVRFEVEVDGVSVWLIDEPEAFDRPGIYGPQPGTGYDDQWFRFGRFSARVRELSESFDVVHLHDAHAAAAALHNPAPTVFTIHNAAYSILGPLPEVGALLDLQPLELGLGGPIEWYGQANFLKAGIARAFRVTTVSPTFARQLLEDPTISGGLQGVLRSRADGVAGILNGIDTRSWDPRTDPSLPAPFSPGRLRGRAMARSALLEQAGLDPGSVLFGNVGRMAEQKGIGLLDPSLPELVEEGLRLVLVGNGELDHVVDGWAERFPEAVWHAPYDEGLARLVSAGTDAYLMPSRFEPCGLGQMYAMRYGSVPVVRLTGGLADSVIDLDEHPADGTGFGFRSFLPESLAKTVRRAMRVFRKSRSDWRRLQRNGMHRDFSWDRAAAQYLDVYDSVLG